MGKRIAIVGTAESWKDTPWNDPGLEIWGLNDAYTLGLPRVDRWFELHPIDHFYFRPLAQRVVYAEDVPHGYYVRPQGHLEKLQEMAKTIPVYLQKDPPKGWPINAQRLPLEKLISAFGSRLDAKLGARVFDPISANAGVDPYIASGPWFEVALAILEGADEIQIWGIHLATEQEYRDQRSNFENILGIARGMGIKVVMAEKSPVLKHGWQYAYEPKPAMHPAKEQLFRVRQEKSALISQMATGPRKPGALDRLRRMEAMEADCLRVMQQRKPVVITAPVLGV